MKIGDFVQSEKWGFSGVILDLGTCFMEGCGKQTLAIKTDAGNVWAHYHADTFEVVPREENR